MNVFLDTNVLLDWLLDRQDTFANEATAILEASEKKNINAYVSAGSIYTIAYVLEKSGKKGEDLRRAMQKVLGIIKVIEADNAPYQKACARDMKDIEDAFQYEVALHNGKLNYFVTANLRDFATQNTASLPVITPAQLLRYF